MSGRIDTAGLRADECGNRMPAGGEYDDALPEGAAVAILFFVAAVLFVAAAVVLLAGGLAW